MLEEQDKVVLWECFKQGREMLWKGSVSTFYIHPFISYSHLFLCHQTPAQNNKGKRAVVTNGVRGVTNGVRGLGCR